MAEPDVRSSPPPRASSAVPGQDLAVDRRRLPLYAADEVEVPFTVGVWAERLPRDTFWEEHAHPTHELLWNERGASWAAVGRRVWTITPGTGLWIPAGTRHFGWARAGTGQRAAQFGVRAAPAISGEAVAVEITALLRLVLDRLDSPGLGADARARTAAMVLDLLVPARYELTLRIPESPLLVPIFTAVRDDPADATTLTAWAARLGVSTRTVTRAFQAETGVGFSRWLATARMQHAVAMLARGDAIDEVAAHVGYHSVSAFGAAFRRISGLSPGRFRAQ